MLKNSPHHQAGCEDWDDYVAKGKFPVDAHRYTNRRGKLIVDRILRFERLNEDLQSVAERLGFEFQSLKASEKSGWREKGIDPTRAQREQIYRAFSLSNRYTGYRQD